MTAALSIEHLNVSYRTPRGLVSILKDISLTLYHDEILGVVGESGSGKSTLAQAIMRLLKPNTAKVSGRVMIGSKDLYALSTKELQALRAAIVEGTPRNQVGNVRGLARNALDAHLVAHQLRNGGNESFGIRMMAHRCRIIPA